MSDLQFLLTLCRVTATVVGIIVMLMWLAGCIGMADFRLDFVVRVGQP
ncbi:hypothetical protein [Chitiniphilus shinanonensis]